MSRINSFSVCIHFFIVAGLAACSSDNASSTVTPPGGSSGASSSAASGSTATSSGTHASDGGSASDAGSSTASVSFARDIKPLFESSCGTGGAACHGDPSVKTMGAGGNREFLGPGSASTIISDIVGVPSFEDPSMMVVKAGDPNNSFLMHKMDNTLSGLSCTGTVGCGLLMPFGATTMPKSQRDLVRSWIAQGAQNN